MIIRNASIYADVENLEEFDLNIHNRVDELGGYFEEATINDYSSEYSESRSAYYTIRIPAKNLDGFLSKYRRSK